MPSLLAIRTDLWSGLFWIVFGGAIIAYSVTMPIPRHLGATVLTGPGLVPALLGGALILLGAVLSVRALRGQSIEGADQQAEPDSVSAARALGALVLMFIYAAFLASRQPFVPCTVVFITLFVSAFNWAGRNLRGRVFLVAGALALGLAVAFAVEFVFETVFLVRLP